MELLQLFSYFSLASFTKNLESLLNTAMGQDDLICDDFGWWSGSNKGGNSIYDVDKGFSTIWGSWEPTMKLFHPMERHLSIPSLWFMVEGFHRRCPFQ